MSFMTPNKIEFGEVNEKWPRNLNMLILNRSTERVWLYLRSKVPVTNELKVTVTLTFDLDKIQDHRMNSHVLNHHHTENGDNQ